MTRTILVTAATGTVGQHVVRELVDRDAIVRVASRDPDGADEALDAHDEAVAFDFEKPETWGEALADVDVIFLVRPPVVGADALGRFVEAAARVGVEQVAFLSTLGAEKNPLVPHHRIEKRIAATDLEYTFLRASFFTQNLLEVHRRGIVERDAILVPAGDGTTSFVDARDLGAVAATALTEPGHGNRAYDLTGPEALDYHEVAAVFSDVLDRKITYENPSIREFVSWRRRLGDPWPFVGVMIALYTTARLGLAGRVTNDVERILGRPPRDVRDFVEDYATEFEPEGEAVAGEDGSVETRGPPIPEVAYEIINPAMAALLRSPLHGLVSDSLMLITFTGRKSGDEYTTPVGYWVKDGTVIVMTHSPWWRNLKGGQPVTLRLQGKRRDGIATPRHAPETVAEYVQAFIDRNGIDAAQRLGIRVNGDREPTYEELVEGVEGTVVIEIELSGGGPPT
ncbi:MAG: nitroreductase/quinone reductase family protein [archaeon]